MNEQRDYGDGRGGIRLIDALVVFGVLALIIAVVAPALYYSREAARLTQCRNNQKMIGLALHNYHDTFGSFPFGAVGNLNLPPEKRWSWYVGLIPYLEQAPIPPINSSTASDDPANLPLTFDVPWKGGGGLHTFHLSAPFGIVCPNGEGAVDRFGQALTTYIGTSGVGDDAAALPAADPRAGVWGYERQSRMGEIATGTLLVMETGSDRGSWLSGGPATVRGVAIDGTPQIGEGRRFGGLHSEGAMATFVDGSVRVVSTETDPAALAAMATVAKDAPERWSR